MVGETILPQVDFFKTEGSKLFMSNFWGKITEKDGVKKNVSKINASRFANDFYIFTLDWSADKLEWKINGLTVKTQTKGVPQEPMYVILNSIVNKPVNDNLLPIAMEIDWVKCYQKA
jgi:beta-glucanase (GH16 family)